MLPRPATMVTAVIVTFTIAGVLKLSIKSANPDDDRPREFDARDDIASTRFESDEDQGEDSALESSMESTTDLEEAEVAPAPELDPDTVDDLLTAIDTLEELSEEGRRACDELGEPFYDFEKPGPAGDDHIALWNEFAREWEDQVSRAASRLPQPPTWNSDPTLVAAYQDVTNAMSELRHATMGGSAWPVPQHVDWTARFDEANRLLEQSRARLTGQASE